MIEQWRPVVGYEGLYEVSSLGNVKSMPKEWICGSGRKCSHNGKIMSQTRSPEGYPQIRLRKYGRVETVRIHRIVADAFIPNPNGYKCVNHIDSNRSNNMVDNLEWVSHSGNRIHALTLGNAESGDESPLAKLRDVEIIAIMNMPRYVTNKLISNSFNVSESLISIIRSGKYPRANKLNKQFKSDYDPTNRTRKSNEATIHLA